MPRLDDIELRRGTAAQWTAANPILDAGEPGWDTTTPQLKIGDGATAWNALPAFGGGGGGGAPTGPAGGSLAGTYPNPTLSSADLTAIALLATTAFGRDFLVMANAAAVFTKLGLGTAASQNTGAFDAAGAAAAAQAASQPLATILTNLVANGTPGTTGLALLLAATAAAARTTLGLGTAALNNTGDFAPATPTMGTGLATTGAVTLDMAALDGTYQKVGQTGALTYTTSNRVAGRTVTLFIKNTTGGALGVTWPAWIPQTVALITSIPAGKTLTGTVVFQDTTDAAAVASTTIQP